MRLDDLFISLAYFSIPIQLVVSLYKYPRLASMPIKVVILCVLFALFIFFCGFGHLMRCLDLADTTAFTILNGLTCVISVITALYLLPLVPILMSELDSSLQDLKKLNEETEASKRKLFTFMSFLCHEIRNPLFAITSNIEFAQDMVMTTELEESLQSINQSANLMLRLVNDVLDISKIESGKLELEEHEFDIREFFSNLASTMGRQIQTKRQGRVEFVFNMAHSLPRIVQSDSVRLLQIAYNILSNACKFTEQGTITFSVSLADRKKRNRKQHQHQKNNRTTTTTTSSCGALPDDDDDDDVFDDDSDRDMFLGNSDHPGGSGTAAAAAAAGGNKSDSAFSMALLEDVEAGRAVADVLAQQQQQEDEDATAPDVRILKMTFEDTGTGIAPEQLEKIFQPYAQSKLSDFRKHGGTGLGLSIISKLLDMMGGSVKVSSVLHEGSKFVVLLPVLVPKQNKNNSMIRKRNSFARLDDLVDASELAGIEAATAESHTITATPLEATPITVAAAIPATTPPDHHHHHHHHHLHQETCPLVSWKRPHHPQPPPTGRAPPPSDSLGRAPPSDLLSQPPTPPTHPLANPPLMPAAAPTALMVPPPPPAQAGGTPATSLVRPSSSASSTKPALGKFQFPKNTNVVLVVDDNAVNRKLIGKMLSFFHVEYQTAEHGEEAVQIMRQSRNVTNNPTAPHFGLVLMDLCMPVMDGYDAIECLRGLGKGLKWLPIVALTANAMAEEKRKALEAGATDFTTKPILRNVLHATCVQHLGPTVTTTTPPTESV